MEKGRQ